MLKRYFNRFSSLLGVVLIIISLIGDFVPQWVGVIGFVLTMYGAYMASTKAGDKLENDH